MNSILARLKSVFFGCMIKMNGNDIDVYSASGEHLMAVRDGRDQSEQLGCSKRFSLEPIPKACRLFKEVNGKIVKDDKYEERLIARKEFLDADGYVLSCEELKAKGFEFDKDGVCVKRPAVAAPAVA